MKKNRLKTKIFLDGGDPEETRRAKELLGFLDGQTTNPSLIAKQYKEGVQGSRFKVQGKMTEEYALGEYKRIVQEMSKIIPEGSVSIQVFSNLKTKAEEMLAQARKRARWIPNASIKFPCTREGLKAASIACREMPVNITLVFSQAQAAAVYSATLRQEPAEVAFFSSSNSQSLDPSASSGLRTRTDSDLPNRPTDKDSPTGNIDTNTTQSNNSGWPQAESVLARASADSKNVPTTGSFASGSREKSLGLRKYPIFISPFVGRLDDRGEVGMEVVRNILRMFQSSKFKVQSSKITSQNTNTHVEVLTASIRNLDHLMYALYLGSDIVTLPFKILEEWAEEDFKVPGEDYKYEIKGLKPIAFDNSIRLGRPWQEYDLSHRLTTAGVKKFWDDWKAIVN